jgi:glycosyltransferase involved in cell wall biosynthesis
MPMPLVSVLMPAFNAESTIIEAVNSILTQSYDRLELIVVDDGSTDNTLSILQSIQSPKIKIISKPNGGIVSALNLGIDHCCGDFIARMDADDISLLHRIEKQVEFLKINREIDVVSSSYTPFSDEEGQRHYEKKVIHPLNPSVIHWLLRYYCVLAHPAVMMRRRIIDNGERYNNVFAEDLDLWRRVSNGLNISNVQESLLLYRRTSSSLSSQNRTNIHKETLNLVYSAPKPTLRLLISELLIIQGISKIGIFWRWVLD